MSRKPTDDVAASTTVTLRLTPDDRARIDRQIATRTDLPERTISALLRRLVREAEGGAIVLPSEERALLEGLVKQRAEELARLTDGDGEVRVTASSILRRIIRDAAKARGITAPPTTSEPATSAAAEPTAHDEPEKAHPTAPDVAAVHAALLAAVKQGTSQRQIAKGAGIDPGQLSRFVREGSGLSADRLVRLADALEKRA